jgi:hypothetical protein
METAVRIELTVTECFCRPLDRTRYYLRKSAGKGYTCGLRFSRPPDDRDANVRSRSRPRHPENVRASCSNSSPSATPSRPRSSRARAAASRSSCEPYWTETSIVEPARAASLTEDVMVDFRTATTMACAEQAQLLARRRPLFVAFPQTVSHAQAQFAVELAKRGVDVLVCAERAAFVQLIDDPGLIRAS